MIQHLTGGQFAPEKGGQFGAEISGQLIPESGGQVHRNLQLRLMGEHIKKCLTGQNIGKAKVDILVMGSNCMQDFIESSLKQTAIKHEQTHLAGIPVIKLDSIKFLFEEIKGKRYLELAEYYPQNKIFMYGADKALVNLFEICEYLSVEFIIPTNESLSTALVGMLSHSPDSLLKYNIVYSSL